MIEALTRRARDESAFTLLELLVVLVVLAIIMLIAIPSYLGFRDRASNTAESANLRTAVPAVEAYFSDNDGTSDDADNNAATRGYQGMTRAHLLNIDQAIANGLTIEAATLNDYCVEVGGFMKSGPSSGITSGACP